MRELLVFSGSRPGTQTSALTGSCARFGSQCRLRSKSVALHCLLFICASIFTLLQTSEDSHAKDNIFEQHNIHNFEKYVFYNDHSNVLRKFETSRLVFNLVSLGSHTQKEMIATHLSDLREFSFGKLSTTILPKGRLQNSMISGTITIVFGSKKEIENHNLLDILKSTMGTFEAFEIGTNVVKWKNPKFYTRREYRNAICTSFSSLYSARGDIDSARADRVMSIVFIESVDSNSKCLTIQFMWLIGFANVSHSIGTGRAIDALNFSNEVDILMDNTIASGMSYESFKKWRKFQLK